mmetsp:Transcript_2273/g.5166  ORF Transcript_2273/g.5166 Transcript_2273/m.5166 type:complete len:85 (+) Transcript_2273:2622-2876(+)
MERRSKEDDDGYLPLSVSLDIQAHSETDSVSQENLEVVLMRGEQSCAIPIRRLKPFQSLNVTLVLKNYSKMDDYNSHFTFKVLD